jgi:hypothetical protein
MKMTDSSIKSTKNQVMRNSKVKFKLRNRSEQDPQTRQSPQKLEKIK